MSKVKDFAALFKDQLYEKPQQIFDNEMFSFIRLVLTLDTLL